MELDRSLKTINQTPILIIAVAVAAGVGFSAGNTQTSGSPSDPGLSWEGKYTVQVNGEVIDRSSNVLTQQGQNQIAGKLFNTSAPNLDQPNPNNFAFIGVGNGTEPGLKDDVLNEEISLSEDNGNITRALADSLSFDKGENGASGTNATYTLKKTFIAKNLPDGGAITVNTTGLYFNKSGPSLVSGGQFTGADLKNGDKLTVTHEITISGS